MTRLLSIASAIIALPAAAQGPADVATVTVAPPKYETVDTGRRMSQDVSLANTLASYTLRYDIIELADDPGKVGSVKWAFTNGYAPLGIAAPSMANWYNQGFLMWTFDGKEIHDYPATLRVIHESGPDAMVEYVWDTPDVTATARFALTAGSDKLLLFGSYEPKVPIDESKLRLMCYPSTFTKPWVRRTVTSEVIMTEGSRALDLETERWVVFEDVAEGRPGAGSAGLLLGDATAYSEATVGAGGYANYANLTLAPDRQSFAVGLYEFPDMPDPAVTRDYFSRMGDEESDAIAQLASADLDQPLAPIPFDAARLALILRRDAAKFERPAEIWRPDAEALDFPWAAKLPDGPVRVALLCGRWTAFETMELGRRLEMDVEHLYFDTKASLSEPGNWPYRNQTGIGALGLGVAERHGVQICTADDREVMMVAGLNSNAIPKRLREIIVDQVQAGKGLILTGETTHLRAWPEELFADRDDSLVDAISVSMPWDEIPGLRPGERGRVTEGPPFEGYRFGEGRVIVFRSKLGHYSSLVPLSDAVYGLDAAMDRVLAMHAKAVLAATDRDLPVDVSASIQGGTPTAGEPIDLAVTANAPEGATVSIRVQDGFGRLLATRTATPNEDIALAGMASGSEHFVDILVRGEGGECLGFAAISTTAAEAATIGDVALSPGVRSHPAAPTVVDLVDGGALTCDVTFGGLAGLDEVTMGCVVTDCFGRTLAATETPVTGARAVLELPIARPVTVAHHVDVTLVADGKPLAFHREPFTVPVPYPLDDFTLLMWTYAGGEPSVRRTDRMCYELGAEMSDLCHVGGYADEAAAREYAVSAQSGMRMIPYVTRLSGAGSDGVRSPCLHDEDYRSRAIASIANTSTQAAPYAPVAYTLGDENYLTRNSGPGVCSSPETMAAFRDWLEAKYVDVADLNAAWATDLGGFADVAEPMTLVSATEQTESFAPWFDHRLFMDTAFAETHDLFADAIRGVDPGAKVGWDGLLSYHWQAGYDFYQLSRNMELNQVYTSIWPQDEFVRSFAQEGALTGQWGNSVADNEDGFAAMAWHNAFNGHNSAWWWTSWGCDYIPFNPDHSISEFGRWHFDAANEVTAGPGKLLVNAKRDNSGIAVLYNQAGVFAAKLAEKVAPGSAFAGDATWLDNHKGLLRALQDLGYQFEYVAAAEIDEQGAQALEGFQALFLPLATCISDEQVTAIKAFANAGGAVIADGRPGILTGSGVPRQDRPLDDLFGVESPSGMEAFAISSAPLPEGAALPMGPALEPGIEVTTGAASMEFGNQQHVIAHDSALLLNSPFRQYNSLRVEEEADAFLQVIAQPLAARGMRPYCTLGVANGPAQCVEQAMFVSGDIRYLCLEQDILLRGIEPQTATLTLPEPSIVYDMRDRKQVGDGPVQSWEVEISRGRPLMFALMPYEVTGLSARVASEATLGDELSVNVRVEAEDATAQYHVVRMDVYAPGSDSPHRQYSQNLGCEAGVGRATIPFALNDTEGEWRIVCTDSATGVSAEKQVELAP